jgi:hypothetical protein
MSDAKKKTTTPRKTKTIRKQKSKNTESINTETISESKKIKVDKKRDIDNSILNCKNNFEIFDIINKNVVDIENPENMLKLRSYSLIVDKLIDLNEYILSPFIIYWAENVITVDKKNINVKFIKSIFDYLDKFENKFEHDDKLLYLLYLSSLITDNNLWIDSDLYNRIIKFINKFDNNDKVNEYLYIVYQKIGSKFPYFLEQKFDKSLYRFHTSVMDTGLQYHINELKEIILSNNILKIPIDVKKRKKINLNVINALKCSLNIYTKFDDINIRENIDLLKSVDIEGVLNVDDEDDNESDENKKNRDISLNDKYKNQHKDWLNKYDKICHILKKYNTSIIIDGMNCFYNIKKKETNNIDIDKLKKVCNNLIKNYEYIFIVFNIKHKNIIEKELENDKIMGILNIIYSPRGKNDDILAIYLWLENFRNRIATKDEFTDHVKYFHDNLYFYNLWKTLYDNSVYNIDLSHEDNQNSNKNKYT